MWFMWTDVCVSMTIAMLFELYFIFIKYSYRCHWRCLFSSSTCRLRIAALIIGYVYMVSTSSTIKWKNTYVSYVHPTIVWMSLVVCVKPFYLRELFLIASFSNPQVLPINLLFIVQTCLWIYDKKVINKLQGYAKA